jgi:hypothetical protein
VSLDDDLAAWAAAVSLPEAEADAIYQRIVRTPAPAAVPRLDPSWWRDFTAGFAAQMIVSTRPARRAA